MNLEKGFGDNFSVTISSQLNPWFGFFGAFACCGTFLNTSNNSLSRGTVSLLIRTPEGSVKPGSPKPVGSSKSGK